MPRPVMVMVTMMVIMVMQSGDGDGDGEGDGLNIIPQRLCSPFDELWKRDGQEMDSKLHIETTIAPSQSDDGDGDGDGDGHKNDRDHLPTNTNTVDFSLERPKVPINLRPLQGNRPT